MANLAIKGHATRGKEVIELLEMMGGKNTYGYTGDMESLYFSIYSDTIVYGSNRSFLNDNYVFFTLEEFIEKFPYKVGDIVKVAETGKIVSIEYMSWRSERCEVVYETCYNNDCVAYYSTTELQPYKEETMEEKADKSKALKLIGEDYYGKRFRYKIPNGYEFDCIKNNEIILKPIQPQYPKTYEECCKILGCKADHFFTSFDYNGCDVEISEYEDKVDDLLQNFRKLRYARDTYWKIAGDWKPDWTDNHTKYIITVAENEIYTDVSYIFNYILSFPTEEMRDTFLENFKDLIEQCKALL